MKRVLLFATISLSLHAGTVGCLETPVVTPDGQTVCADSAGLGKLIYATPGTVALAMFNDNYGNSAPNVGIGDFDFDDANIKLLISLGLPGSGLARIDYNYFASSSAETNLLTVNGSPTASFLGLGSTGTTYTPIGSVITIDLLDVSTGYTYHTGGPGANNDHAVHAWTSQQQVVPEVSTWLMMAFGGLVLIGRKRLLNS